MAVLPCGTGFKRGGHCLSHVSVAVLDKIIKRGITHALTQPSFSGTLVICAHLPQTTLPVVVTRPSSETLTSIMVPLVKTPSWVKRGLLGFFLTERMGSWTVTPSSGLEAKRIYVSTVSNILTRRASYNGEKRSAPFSTCCATDSNWKDKTY